MPAWKKNEMFLTGLGLTNYLYYLKFGLFLCYQSIFILYLLMTNLFDKQLKKKVAVLNNEVSTAQSSHSQIESKHIDISYL